MSASIRRSSPIAINCGTGRSAGAPGAASRVRPNGEPSSSRSSSSCCGSLSPSISSAICCGLCAASSSVTCPTYQGSPPPASEATRTSRSPQASARSFRSSSASRTSASGARSPISVSSLATGTGAVSAWSTNSASITASRRKSSSSVAAFSDWRACARAASAAMLPGGGCARSGRSSSRRISRSSGNSASQDPSGMPGVCSVIADQRKAVERLGVPSRGRVRRAAPHPTCQNGSRG